MATWRDVSRLALALPQAEEGTAGHDRNRAWKVRKKLFVWERPLRKSDLAALRLLLRGVREDDPTRGGLLLLDRPHDQPIAKGLELHAL
jgi:hypothetical protein